MGEAHWKNYLKEHFLFTFLSINSCLPLTMDYLYICCLKCDSSFLSYNCIAFGLLYEKM